MGTKTPIKLDGKKDTRNPLIPMCDALFPQDGKDTFSGTSFDYYYHSQSLLGFIKNIRIVKTYQGIFQPARFPHGLKHTNKQHLASCLCVED